jgi:hypothetical protein
VEDDMQELEPTWGRTIAVWWLIFWRGLLGSMLLGGVIGFIFGFVAAMSGMSPQQIATISPFLGAAVALPWAILVVKMALQKTYSDFRIALVPRT